MKKILLAAWAEARYDPPPSPRVLQRWAREGEIVPKPVKVGRSYYVAPDARRLAEGAAGRPSVVDQMRARAAGA